MDGSNCSLICCCVLIAVVAVQVANAAPMDHAHPNITPRCLRTICLVSGGCKRSDCADENLGCGYFNMTRSYFQGCKFCYPNEINSEETLTSAWKECSNQKACAECCVMTHLDTWGEREHRRQITQERDQCKLFSKRFFKSTRIQTDSQEVLDFVRKVDDAFVAVPSGLWRL